MTRPTQPRPVGVGIDGSEAARTAAAFAVEEARLRDTSLRMLHALSWPPAGVAARTEPDVDLRTMLRTGAETALRGAAAQAAYVLGGERVTWSVVDPDPVTALRSASDDAQLIVVGGRGVGGVAGLLVGSTANGLVAHSSCPVVVLPDPTSAAISPRSSVVVGVEGRPEDDVVLDFAFAEAAARGTDLVAVHAWQDIAVETAFQSMSPFIDWAGALADEEDRKS